MKTILGFLALSLLLPSCALQTKSGSANLNPDPETVRAVGELVRIVLSDK